MSHQTGIEADDELKSFFATAYDGHIRLIKVGISDEQLVLSESCEPKADWESDYDECILPLLEEEMPCYLLYRMDTKNNLGHEWIFISYSPDNSPVRQKMLYAGTRANVKKEFGGGHLKDELFGTNKDDVCLRGYHKHVEVTKAPPPLTYEEQEKQMIKVEEPHNIRLAHQSITTLQHVLTNVKDKEQPDNRQTNHAISVSTKQTHMTGVFFPVSDEGLEQLEAIQAKKVSLVLLKLDTEQEIIGLDKSESDVEPNDLSDHLPKDEGRYVFYLFKHTHEGDYQETIVFVYTMPGYSCPIKERMLYSSCKGPLLQVAEEIIGMDIPKKIEISDSSELSEEFLQDELHPKRNLHRPKFAKPKPPPGRGAKRMTKPTKPEE